MSLSTITISSFSFDKIITNYYPKASIAIISDTGVKMTVSIEISQQNNIETYIHFSHNDMSVSYERLDASLLSLLVDTYYKHINTKLSNSHLSISSRPRLKDIKSLRNIFRSIFKISKLLERYQDLRAVNICTSDKLQNKTLARTTIEMDGDIITIINSELLKTNSVDIFMNLHSANVRLANYLYVYRLVRTFAVIKVIKNVARIISIPLWIILNAMIFPSKILSVDYQYLFMIFSYIGIPAILYKFIIPRILSFVIRRKLT